MSRVCALILLTILPAASIAAERPNVVFICADDLGINDLACYGRSDHRTPHLDRLAAEGVRFTTAYCAQPICSPTRAALMTGKSPARLHLTTFLPGRADARSQMLLHPATARELPLADETIAEMLSAAGYATACIGKWHLGGAGFGPREQGFASVFPGNANTTPSAEEGGKGEYALTAQAVQFIEANRTRPFFLYLAHNNPHVPLDAQRERIAKHDAAFNPVYAAMVETLDECVGNLVAAIDRLGLREKTLVVFTSDNGGLHVLETNKTPATHNTPYRAGKGYLYEGGLRIPLIVRWPGTIAGNVIEPTPVISADWVPTLLEVAGVRSAAAPFDGVSLASLLSARASLPARPLYWHFPHYTNQGGRPGGAVREDAWKLIEHYEDGRAELFHLGNDPGETTDLSASEPKRAAELRGKLASWREAVGAQTNRPNPRFDASLAARIYRAIDSSRLNAQPRAEPMRAKLAGWRAALNEALKDDPAAKVGPVVILAAKDALIDGKTVRYEPEPQKNAIGFWTDPADRIRWTFELGGGGDFDVELLQGCKGGGSEVEIGIGESSLRMSVKDTGHFQNFVPVTAGRVTLGPGTHTVVVAPRTKRGPAVMDLRSITLRPVAPAVAPL